MVRHIYYGRYITADISQQIHYGMCIMADILQTTIIAMSPQIHSTRISWVEHSKHFVAAHHLSEPRDLLDSHSDIPP